MARITAELRITVEQNSDDEDRTDYMTVQMPARELPLGKDATPAQNEQTATSVAGVANLAAAWAMCVPAGGEGAHIAAQILRGRGVEMTHEATVTSRPHQGAVSR